MLLSKEGQRKMPHFSFFSLGEEVGDSSALLVFRNRLFNIPTGSIIRMRDSEH